MESGTSTRHEPPGIPPPVRRLLEVLAGAAEAERAADVSAVDFSQSVPAGQYPIVIGAVPFAGSIEARKLAADVRALARSRRAELVAIAWALLALKEGGRLALVVPASVLDADTQAHRVLRRRLVEENALQAVIRLRAGLFRPRTRAAILVASKGAHSQRIGFHELKAARDIPQLIARWPAQRDAPAAGSSFFVRREDVAPPAYSLDMERYRTLRAAAAPPPSPHQLLHEIAGLEAEILQGIRDLVGMLK